MTESPTVVEHDNSWVGRLIVTLVLIALVVVGAVWLVNEVNDGGGRAPDRIENDVDVNPGDGGEGDTGDTNPAPSPT